MPGASSEECYINHSAVQRLRGLLQRDAQLSDVEEHTSSRTSADERRVGRVASLEAFSRFSDRYNFLADCINLDVVVREIPYAPHSVAQCQVGSQLTAQAAPWCMAATAIDVSSRANQNTSRTPDVALLILGQSNQANALLPGRTGYPAVVVEIAASQTPLDLHQRAAYFLGADSPGTEFYIGLKRYDPRFDGTQAMIASVYDRARAAGAGVINFALPNPQLISFGSCPLHATSFWGGAPVIQGVGYGGPPCNAAGLVPYTILIPTARVFATRVGGVPAGVPPNFTLDLFHVHQAFRLLHATV